MKITVLAEDTSVSDKFKSEHGLSFYIETKNHRILFDTGASPLFKENAEKLGIDISEVDTVIISHGHYDHGGGLKTLLENNDKAKIYIRKIAFDDYYSQRPNGESVYIGLDKILQKNPQFAYTDGYSAVDEELELFSGVTGREMFSKSNGVCTVKKNGELICDGFEHEQNLIITENGKNVLICGCAHNGIINILSRFADIKAKAPDYVLGGFHLSNPRTKVNESKEFIDALGDRLKQSDSVFYTCHCTGIEPYNQLKQILKDKINYAATGSTIEIK